MFVCEVVVESNAEVGRLEIGQGPRIDGCTAAQGFRRI
jgi:hypothetical protein